MPKGFLGNWPAILNLVHFAVFARRYPHKLFKEPVEIGYIIEAYLHRNIGNIIFGRGQQLPGTAYPDPVYIAREICAFFCLE